MSGLTKKSYLDEIDDIINRYLSIVNTAPGWMEALANKKRERAEGTSK